MKPNKKRLLAVLIAAVSFTAVSAQRLITDYLNCRFNSERSNRIIRRKPINYAIQNCDENYRRTA